jgi:bifunctional non-homologous end joining protein LigD
MSSARPSFGATETASAQDPDETADHCRLSIGRSLILDGEIVCLDTKGGQTLRRSADGCESKPATRRSGRRQVAGDVRRFDVLHVEGESTCGWPWTNRRSLLETLRLDERVFRVAEAFVG